MRNIKHSKGWPQQHRRRHKNKLTLPDVRKLVLVVAGAIAGLTGAPETEAIEMPALAQEPKRGKAPVQASFDLEAIKQRGLDPKIAEYFRDAPRFAGGTHMVTLYLNGVKRGLVDARFDREGQLCFNRELIDKAGLAIPDPSFLLSESPPASLPDGAVAAVQASAASCYDFHAMFAQTEVKLRPSKAEVSLVVPTAALRAQQDDFSGYATGGTAGLFNYDAVSLTNQFNGGSNQYLSASTELGFNSHDWIIRSRQSYTQFNNRTNFQSLYTYGQRALMDSKSVLQVGQINIGSSVVGGSAITGFQVMPETALRNQNRGGASVEGIAQSQARVEVRQVGALIYSTVVPAGPFSLENIPVLNGNADLVVTVIEANGAKRSFTVAAASLGVFTQAVPGYSFAAGKVRNFGGNDSKTPMVATGSGGWQLNERHQLSAGLMVASSYQSVGWGLDSAPTTRTVVNVRNVFSSATDESVRGAQFSMTASTALTEKFSVSASVTRQSNGYRDIQDTTYARDIDLYSRAQSQYSASLNWTDATVGGFSVSYSNSTAYNGPSAQRVVASWGKTFKRATVSANLERNLGNRNTGELGIGAANDNAFYINVSIPLGRRSVNTYVNNSDGRTRLGTSVSEQVNDYVNYRVAAERKTPEGEVDVSGNLSLLPRYTQVNLSYARNGSGSTSYVGQVRGGIALHDAGLTFSPYQIQDTFGVMQVGDVSGVRINTPGGPVWTDAWGRAVVPTLSAYRNSRLEVATKSLPRNVDIKNGYKSVDAGRGSVHRINFDVVKVRRVLLDVTNPDGAPLSKGASVMDNQDQFLTTVVDDGKVFLSNGQLTGDLKVNLPDETQCRLDFRLPERSDLNIYFETTSAVCRPLGLVPKI